MRDLKFKAISLDTGKWIYGYGVVLHKEENLAVIIGHVGGNLMQNSQVIPETVCQFTGLLDKNGVEIYEGDILSNINHYEDNKPYYSMHKVLHSDEYTGWVCINLANKTDDLKTNGNCQLWVYLKNSDCEITGNIHDK